MSPKMYSFESLPDLAHLLFALGRPRVGDIKCSRNLPISFLPHHDFLTLLFKSQMMGQSIIREMNRLHTLAKIGMLHLLSMMDNKNFMPYL